MSMTDFSWTGRSCLSGYDDEVDDDDFDDDGVHVVDVDDDDDVHDDDVHDVDIVHDVDVDVYNLGGSRCRRRGLVLMTVTVIPGWLGIDYLRSMLLLFHFAVWSL